MDKHGKRDGLEDGPKVNIHLDSFRATFKKYQIRKRLVMKAYMDAGFKKSLSSTDA